MFNIVLSLHVISAIISIGTLGLLLFRGNNSFFRTATFSSHAVTFLSGFSLFFLGSSLQRVCSSLLAYALFAGGILVIRKLTKNTGCPYLDSR